jgi:hypothetical protein
MNLSLHCGRNRSGQEGLKRKRKDLETCDTEHDHLQKLWRANDDEAMATSCPDADQW